MTDDAQAVQTGATAVAAVAPRKGQRFGPPPWVAWFFLLPALILLGVWVVYSTVFTVIRSFFDETGGFLGLGNYVTMFRDPGMLTTIKNNVIWVVVAPSLVTILGLLFAVLTERIKWVSAFKLIVFMPMAISFMASGIIFRLVYDQAPERGVANAIVTSVHGVFSPAAGYPGASPRQDPQSPVVSSSGRVQTRRPYAVGQSVLIPLVGVQAQQLPEEAVTARAPAAGSGLSGTVWFDFTRGGGGVSGALDGTEKGLPGMTVEAVRGGEVVATTETGPDGTFVFSGLPAGSYVVRLPPSNFEAPFRGLPWLGPTLVTPAIIGAYLWVWAGFAMVLISAGLATIPRDVLEAARVDGASEFQVFRRITGPLLMPVLTVVFVTLVINVLKIFDLVLIVAPTDVQPQANVLALEMWRQTRLDAGLASAIAVLLFALVVPAMIFNIRRFRRELR